jgi:hypothetical protein
MLITLAPLQEQTDSTGKYQRKIRNNNYHNFIHKEYKMEIHKSQSTSPQNMQMDQIT